MPIPGTVWATDCWDADAWAADTWADSGAGAGPPTLSNVTVGEITPFLCDVSADTDQPSSGTGYVVITTSATAPSVAQIQAGQDHTGAAAVSAGSSAVGSSVYVVPLDGLTEETAYYAHVQQQNSGGDDSTVYTSAQFTTADAAESAMATGQTTGSGSIDPDWNAGTVWWVVTQSATPPSIAQVQAGQNHLGAAADDDGSTVISVNAPVNVSFSGLSGTTQYWAHYQYEGPTTADSPVVSSSSFTTTDGSGGGGVIAINRRRRLRRRVKKFRR